MIEPVFEPRVLVVASNVLTRTGLAALLSQSPDVDVVGQVSAGASLLDDVDIYRPDLIVFDLDYEPLNQLLRLNMLVEAGVPTLALLPHMDRGITTIMATLKALPGAYGLLLRDSEPDLLVSALKAIAAGLMVLDPLLAAQIIPAETELQPELMDELTARESEVLALLANGLTNKAIAQALEISPNTVKFHVNAILAKLQAQSRTEAVVRATQLGLLTL